MNHEDILKAVQEYGLFLCKLNNGDWMVGRASHIYSIRISDDHYEDEHVSIAPTLPEAIKKWSEKNEV